MDALSDGSDDEAPILLNLTAEDHQEQLPPCPVTILSGFLGSGKTTLIQFILKSPNHHKRIAVIENEFGEGLNVESLIARDGSANDDGSSSLQDLIELPNGCVCCTVKDNLVTTLENLLDKRKDLDYIIIEASGMANPGPIASLFWLDDALESRIRLDGIVTLVDAYHIQRQLEETIEAAQQIAYADRILLNKTDLLLKNNNSQQQDKDSNVATEQELLKFIRKVNPTVPIRSTTYSQVHDLKWILDASCFDVQRAMSIHGSSGDKDKSQHHQQVCEDPSTCVTCLQGDLFLPNDNLKEQQQSQHSHTSAISTISLKQVGSVSLRKMNLWLASLLWPNQDEQDKILRARLEASMMENGATTSSAHEGTTASEAMTIFRIKGILSVRLVKEDVDDNDATHIDEFGLDKRRYIVQAVHDLWEIHPAQSNLDWDQLIDGVVAQERVCKMVLIGRYLDKEQLQQGFQECFIE